MRKRLFSLVSLLHLHFCACTGIVLWVCKAPLLLLCLVKVTPGRLALISQRGSTRKSRKRERERVHTYACFCLRRDAARPYGVRPAGLSERPFCNDPYTGSPTKTLLRLLLPRSDQVRITSRSRRRREAGCRSQSVSLTKPLIGSSDGRCVQGVVSVS